MAKTRDKLHQELKVGDTVICSPPYLSSIELGKITKLKPKSVIIMAGNGSEYSRISSKVVKINDQMKMAKNESPEMWI